MELRKIRLANIRNRTILLRVNFDVPMSAKGGSASGRKNGKILDDSRIMAHLPTINYLIKKKARIILISHLDDPFKIKKINPKLVDPGRERKIIKKYSLRLIANYLINRLKLKIKFIDDCLGKKVEKEIEKLKPGEIILLENLRFYPGEENNDKNFARNLASLADIYPVRSSSRDWRYRKSRGEVALAVPADSKKKDLSQTSNGVYVNDAFAVCHRAHASVSAITKFLPSYAGLLLEKEIKNLNEILDNPKHPFIVLMGGAKISTKMPVLKTLAKKADKILVGGALANDILKSMGYKVGESLVEKGTEKLIKDLRFKIKEKIILPVDVIIKYPPKAPRPSSQAKRSGEDQPKAGNIKIEELNNLKTKDFKILDIGPETIELFAKYLRSAKMIVWNGPMGLFEEKPFDRGTNKLLKEILSPCGGSTVGGKNKKAKIVIGGGDTIAALQQSRINADLRRGSTQMGTRINADIRANQRKDQRKSASIFVSTGGGAMLEFLSGKVLPGIKPLLRK